MKRFEPIVAADVATEKEAIHLFDLLANAKHQPIVKIGMELFYAFGPDILREAKKRGLQVFLDVKSYDIPNTVKRAMAEVGQLGVLFVTIHAAGGSAMMKAAMEGVKEGAARGGNPLPHVLAITQLTSIDEKTLHEEQHMDLSLLDSVKNYAELADKSGCDGVVCSAHEVPTIREVTGPDFLCITPGIRPHKIAGDDQKRVMTPRQAYQAGSNGIVVGRPIIQADDPLAAYNQIRSDFFGEE